MYCWLERNQGVWQYFLCVCFLWELEFQFSSCSSIFWCISHLKYWRYTLSGSMYFIICVYGCSLEFLYFALVLGYSGEFQTWNTGLLKIMYLIGRLMTETPWYSFPVSQNCTTPHPHLHCCPASCIMKLMHWQCRGRLPADEEKILPPMGLYATYTFLPSVKKITEGGIKISQALYPSLCTSVQCYQLIISYPIFMKFSTRMYIGILIVSGHLSKQSSMG